MTVEQVESDPHPNGLNVEIIGRDQQMTRSAWWADADPIDYAHEITHLLGLRDESPHAVAPHRPDIAGSLLGTTGVPHPPVSRRVVCEAGTCSCSPFTSGTPALPERSRRRLRSVRPRSAGIRVRSLMPRYLPGAAFRGRTRP
ncbi:hypothetical protein NKH18_17355 [Streptomyces sp. M10(2022)]